MKLFLLFTVMNCGLSIYQPHYLLKGEHVLLYLDIVVGSYPINVVYVFIYLLQTDRMTKMATTTVLQYRIKNIQLARALLVKINIKQFFFLKQQPWVKKQQSQVDGSIRLQFYWYNTIQKHQQCITVLIIYSRVMLAYIGEIQCRNNFYWSTHFNDSKLLLMKAADFSQIKC